MMEVLPFSGTHCVGDAECSQQGSGTPFGYDGEATCLEHGGQDGAVDLKGNAFTLNVQRPQEGKEFEGQWPVDGLSISEGHFDGSSYSNCLVENEGQIAPNNSNDSEEYKFHQQGLFIGNGQFLENLELKVDTIEFGQDDNHDSESLLPEIEWLEQDEPLAVWVKWKGKWQAAIRCARADWPLASFNAKPTHDTNKYLLVFFPCRRDYSWVDVLLIRPIHEFPKPIAHKTHEMGIEMVKDLALPRRFIVLKISVDLLNILEQLNSEALVEVARNEASWKDFAVEIAQCKGYSDTGRMILKLQNMMLQCFFRANFLHMSSQSWIQRCLDADSAESVELLKEELVDSVVWNEVNSLLSKAGQLELGSEMKTWKHEAVQWLSLSNSTKSYEDPEPTSSDSTLAASLHTSRKRAKLEVRRAEVHASQVETESSHQQITLEVDSGFFSSHDVLLGSERSKDDVTVEGASLMGGSPVTDKWGDLVIEAGNSDVIQMKDLEMTASANSMQPLLESKNRQCAAFIEAKGRQCERWASDGGIYCCVHLASQFAGNSAKSESTPVDSIMCEGTTVLGTKCKHRSLPGSSFCKKHQPRGNNTLTLASPENKLKRKLENNIRNKADISNCTDIIPATNGSSLCFTPVSVMREQSFNDQSIEVSERKLPEANDINGVQCIGLYSQEGYESCLDGAKKFSLYCDKHLPSWLKRARNGKSRIVSKEVFLELLKDCHSREQKMHLHQACELFYKLFKSIQSSRNPVPREVQFQWALSEASKHDAVKEYLQRLVSSEKQRLERIWGLGGSENGQDSLSADKSVQELIFNDVDHENSNILSCKLCSEKFVDDRLLGFHWMENHKKEAQWLFRGYACAICLDSFTNKKVLELHMQDRHTVQFVERCMLFQCIPCGGHFGNSEELWSHVVSGHVDKFRLENAAQHINASIGEQSFHKVDAGNSASVDRIIPQNKSGIRKFTCKFCGLKFDLLPDLGRHHQAAHMPPNSDGAHLPRKGIRYYAYKLKTGRLSWPTKFKKGIGSSSYRTRNQNAHTLKKRFQASNTVVNTEIEVQPNLTEASGLGNLVNGQCSAIAKILFSEIKRTQHRPNNSDILAIVQSTCCKTHLQATLEAKYGVLPKRIYLKAAKICSEHNILVTWHQDGFICPKGCRSNEDLQLLSPLVSQAGLVVRARSSTPSDTVTSEWTMDESHYVIDSRYFSQETMEKLVLCDDISFGRESVPIACVVDENLLGSLNIPSDGSDDQISPDPFPWEGFTYTTKSLLHESLCVEAESPQLGCTCGQRCSPGSCDHVYLFDNDYEDAKDIYGKAMHGRFPYDERGRIILEEGYLVYECNQKCSCNKSCPNRVLQKGVQVKLEVFKTEKKGWAVRAREAILRGTFVCEYVGEVVSEQEADERSNRYGEARHQYFYEIDAQVNDMSRLIEGQGSYVIDATNYGNVSRYVNHSCLPNLVNHQVLVESMDCELAHIGLYASRDIAAGEELTCNFRYKLSPEAESPCFCGASNCRGRLH